MRNKSLRWILMSSAAALFASLFVPVGAAEEAQEQAQLAKALTSAKVTLERGIESSASYGKPVSAKFEVEDGKLQLSVYVAKGSGFSEVVINPVSGKVEKTEAMTDKGDLEHATAQKAAMDKSKTALLAAVDKASKANDGYRATSIVPQAKGDHPVADVTLVRGNAFKTVTERLD
jgi:hypothetical protein